MSYCLLYQLQVACVMRRCNRIGVDIYLWLPKIFGAILFIGDFVMWQSGVLANISMYC
jgi:hypothetical protein